VVIASRSQLRTVAEVVALPSTDTTRCEAYCLRYEPSRLRTARSRRIWFLFLLQDIDGGVHSCHIDPHAERARLRTVAKALMLIRIFISVCTCVRVANDVLHD
jgi:hypothetical protein